MTGSCEYLETVLRSANTSTSFGLAPSVILTNPTRRRTNIAFILRRNDFFQSFELIDLLDE